MTKKDENKHHGKSGGSDSPSSEDIRALADSMSELAASLNRFVLFLEDNPEIKDIPGSVRELTKRISVLSTRL